MKIQAALNITRIAGIFHEDHHTFMITFRSVLPRMRNVSDKLYRANQNTILYSIFFPKVVFFMRYCGKIW